MSPPFCSPAPRRSGAGVVLSLLLCWSASAHAAGDPQPPIVLDAAQVAAAGLATEAPVAAGEGGLRHLPARIGVPNAQQSVVATPVSGLAAEVLVAAGDAVKKGQPLARILSAEALTLKREASQAQAEHTLSARTLARDETLFREGIIAESRLQASRAAEAGARALAGERAATLALVGGGVDGSGGIVIRSPIDGVVLEQMARPGARLEAAAPLFHLARLGPLQADIQVPVALAGALRVGQGVRVGEARGRLLAVGRAVGGGQTVEARARLDEGLDGLAPGQLVEAEIEAANSGGAWRVPRAALVRLGEATRSVVFVRRDGGYLPLPAQVVADEGEQLVVRAELRADDAVVSRGASTLKATAMGLGQGE